MVSRTITELASIIATNTKKYNDFLVQEGLPQPSHEPFPVPPKGPPPALPADIAAALEAATEATHELHELLVGPVGLVVGAATECQKIMSLHFIHRYKIAQKLGLNGRKTYKQIADECGLDEDDTRHMLRLAITDHLFEEPENGTIAHTAATQLLAVNPLLSAWTGVATHENWPSMIHMSYALSKWPGSEEPFGHSAYSLAHNIYDNPFDVWEKDPQRAKQFADGMSFIRSDPGFDPKHLINGYDFASVGQGIFVDIGGSHGPVSIAVARAYPSLRCIVQDMPGTVKSGEAALPAELKDRVSFMAHDFWTEQPVKGADIYFFSWIFHDWADKYGVKILRQLIPALKRGARILVYDICMPPPGVVSLYQEHVLRSVSDGGLKLQSLPTPFLPSKAKIFPGDVGVLAVLEGSQADSQGRSIDMVMKSFSNAKERDAEEWATLFAKADPGFQVTSIKVPPGAKSAIIEARWQPDE
ncbi:hypothetical protein MMC30_003597 [Trapelia coarctata]|nr:hypothetical protein [Trapelia coarctata]